MPKSLSLGNGNILILLDEQAQVRDFYFPYVGFENHISGNQMAGHYLHRIAVYVDNTLHWVNADNWTIDTNYKKETMTSVIEATNFDAGIKLTFNDGVYNERNIFLRKIQITNLKDTEREVKLFFAHQFQLYESPRGDTAFYDPNKKVIIHYKGRRVFLINIHNKTANTFFDDYTVGLFGLEGKEGSHIDAEDGMLAKNSVEHGQVDSVMGITQNICPEEPHTIHYWITVSKELKEAYALNDYVLDKKPDHILKSTADFWYAWVNKQNFTFHGLDSDIVQLFKKSLLIVRSHIDTNGAIIAAGDSDMLKQGRDTYAYVWPRDGAFTAIALNKVKDLGLSKNFFSFCNDVITDEGFMLHKYRVDKSLGSSWHPWVRNGIPTLPIQEDETALVLVALWKFYEISRDIEFIEGIYNNLIKKSADFMVKHIDRKSGLPLPSYDLWEEKFGISTFTASTVYYALRAAARFANILGKSGSEGIYNYTAEKIQKGIMKYLYDEETGNFLKMINFENGSIIKDTTIDASSIYGVFRFHILQATDERVIRAFKQSETILSQDSSIGGIARYENDKYYRTHDSAPANPWFITTLWFAQFYIEQAKTFEELSIVKDKLKWAVKYAQHSGILSEQLNPYTGEQLSAAPLTWSHAEFVETVVKYMEKIEKLGISPVTGKV